MDNIDRNTKGKILFEQAINLGFDSFHVSEYLPQVGICVMELPAGQKGLKLMIEAADNGYAQAQYALGIYYLFESIHREVKVENIESDLERFEALRALEKQESQEGIELLKLAALQYHGNACLVLGDIYSPNHYCKASYYFTTDEHKALGYYKMGASAGNADAMCRLGVAYYLGFGVQADDTSAFVWFCKSRDNGGKLMWVYLGDCYLNGCGTNADIPKAIAAYENSLKNMNYLSSLFYVVKLKLACIFRGDFGFEYADFDRAYSLIKSVEENDSEYNTARKMLEEMPEAEAQYIIWKKTGQTKINTEYKGAGGDYDDKEQSVYIVFLIILVLAITLLPYFMEAIM